MHRHATEAPRRAARRAITVTAEIREHGRGGLPLPLDLAEVSESGAFIASDLLLPVGLQLDVAFPVPGGHRVEARGTVVRVDEQVGTAGMGLRFERISDADRATLRAFAAA